MAQSDMRQSDLVQLYSDCDQDFIWLVLHTIAFVAQSKGAFK